MTDTREITYAESIREAHYQLLETDPRVFVIGQGLWSPWYVGATMTNLDVEFGRERILDTPVSENATTGAAVGAALAGMRPIVVHPRMDFMLLAVDPIVNQAANWSYLFGGRRGVGVVVRSIINRGGEQGAQHSQAVHAMFAHVPGLKVVMPATPYDAKGLLVSAVRDGNPVMYIDDRWLYEEVGPVPKDLFEVPIGQAAVRRQGSDVTVVAVSYLVPEALRAADELAARGVDVEVIDLRTVKPLDRDTILASVAKTGHLVVADPGWRSGGLAGEVAASVAEEGFSYLRGPITRVTLPDTPAPVPTPLERAYYPRADDIVRGVEATIGARVVPRAAEPSL
jgi:pyruvate/2-oxoglutarate/acetoin dehydrogenase E1 component